MTDDTTEEETFDDVMLESKLVFPDGAWVKRLYPRSLKNLIHDAVLAANNAMKDYEATIEYEREYPGMKWEGRLVLIDTSSNGDTRIFLRDDFGVIHESKVHLAEQYYLFNGFIKNTVGLS